MRYEVLHRGYKWARGALVFVMLFAALVLVDLARADDRREEQCGQNCQTVRSSFLDGCTSAECRQQGDAIYDKCLTNCAASPRSREEREAMREKKRAAREQRRAEREQRKQARKEQETALATDLRPAALTLVWSMEQTSGSVTTKETLDAKARLELPDFVEHGLPANGFVHDFQSHALVQGDKVYEIKGHGLPARLLGLEGKAGLYRREVGVHMQEAGNAHCNFETVLQGTGTLVTPGPGQFPAVRLLIHGDQLVAQIVAYVPVHGESKSPCKAFAEKGDSKGEIKMNPAGLDTFVRAYSSGKPPAGWAYRSSRKGNTWEAEGHYEQSDGNARTNATLRARLEFP